MTNNEIKAKLEQILATLETVNDERLETIQHVTKGSSALVFGSENEGIEHLNKAEHKLNGRNLNSAMAKIERLLEELD